MSAQLTLAVSEDYPRLAPLMEALDIEIGVAHDAVAREAAIMPLLEGSPLGAVYIIGPTRAPIGFLVMTLTWSLDYGGIMASVREIYVRPGVRVRSCYRSYCRVVCAFHAYMLCACAARAADV